jgi:hypothetical protein
VPGNQLVIALRRQAGAASSIELSRLGSKEKAALQKVPGKRTEIFPCRD